jgi:hypothetical protein
MDFFEVWPGKSMGFNKGYPGLGWSMTAAPGQPRLPGQFFHFQIPIELPG